MFASLATSQNWKKKTMLIIQRQIFRLLFSLCTLERECNMDLPKFCMHACMQLLSRILKIPSLTSTPLNNTFTIPAISKLFSVNVNFSQCQLLTMSKVLRICLTVILTSCPKALSGAWCLSRTKLLGIFFPHLNCKNFKTKFNFFC